MVFQLHLKDGLPPALIFLQWKRFAQKRSRYKKRVQTANNFYVTKLCAKTFQSWSSVTRDARQDQLRSLAIQAAATERSEYGKWKFNERWARSCQDRRTAPTPVNQAGFGVLQSILNAIDEPQNAVPRHSSSSHRGRSGKQAWKPKHRTSSKRLCAHYFHRWRRFRQQRVRADESAITVAVKRRRRLLSGYLVQWHARWQDRRFFDAAVDLHRSRQLSRSFAAWRAHCLNARADLLRKYSMFTRWRKLAHRRRAVLRRGDQLASNIGERRMVNVLAAWRVMAQVLALQRRVVQRRLFRRWNARAERRRNRNSAEIAVGRKRRERLLSSHLLAWRKRLRQNRACERASVVVALRQWAANAKDLRKWHDLAAIADTHRLRKAGARTLKALARNCARASVVRLCTTIAERYRSSALLRRGFRALRSHCEWRQNERVAAELGRQRRLRRAFVAWKDEGACDALGRRDLANGIHAAALLRAGFRALRENVLRNVQHRLALALRQKLDQALVGRYFRKWDRACYEAAMDAFRLRTAQRFYEERLVRKVFFAFVCGTTLSVDTLGTLDAEDAQEVDAEFEFPTETWATTYGSYSQTTDTRRTKRTEL